MQLRETFSLSLSKFNIIAVDLKQTFMQPDAVGTTPIPVIVMSLPAPSLFLVGSI